LLRGALATGGLVVATAVVRFASLLGENAALGRRCLTEREEQVLRSLIEALFPKGGDMPAGDPEFIVPRVDAWVGRTDSEARLLFRAMLHVIEDQAVLHRLSRFSKCSLEERILEVRAWERTSIYKKRMVFSSVKMFIGLQYFDQPGVHESIGFYLGCHPEQVEAPSRAREGLG
jgi:hypothetical protein